MLRSDEGRDSRQVAIMDVQGRTASWDGPGANDWKGHKCAAPLTARKATSSPARRSSTRLASSFESSAGKPFATRLMDALDAAQAAGGDARGMQSAAMIVTRALGWRRRLLRSRHRHSRRRQQNAARRAAPSAQPVRGRSADHRGQSSTHWRRRASRASHRDGSQGQGPGQRQRLGGAGEHPSQKRAGKADALAAIAKATEINSANKRQIPRNRNFESLLEDPEFRRLTRLERHPGRVLGCGTGRARQLPKKT